MDNFFGFLGAYYLIPSLIIGMIGFLLGWFLKPSTKQAGDLSVEGEGALKAEADSLRARVQDLEGQLSRCNTELADATTKLEAAPVASDMAADVTAKTTDADDTYALEWQNRYLAVRVKYLDGRLAELDGAAEAKPVAKSAPVKKKAATKKKAAPAKKTATKAKAVSKPKKTTAAKTTAAAAKAAPKKKAAAKTTKAKTATKKTPAAKSKSETDLDKYLEKVRKYDPRATRKSVDAIVKHCGIALRTRDGRLVACSDEEELRTVADGFVTKKLGLKDGQMDLVKSICEQMKGDRMKSRVVFYYLAAKKAKKLSVFK